MACGQPEGTMMAARLEALRCCREQGNGRGNDASVCLKKAEGCGADGGQGRAARVRRCQGAADGGQRQRQREHGECCDAAESVEEFAT